MDKSINYQISIVSNPQIIKLLPKLQRVLS